MKVIHLNEASMSPQDFENEFKNGSFAEKCQLIIDVLGDKVAAVTKLQKLFDFGENFITRWINAFNSKELLDSKNEFVKFLGTCKDNLPIFDSPIEFMKAYNSYSDGYFNYNALNNKESIFYQLINNNNLYKFNEKDFRSALRIYDYLIKNLGTSEESIDKIKSIFFENPDDPINSKINAIDTIKNLSGEGRSNSDTETENERINRMSNERFNEFIKQLMSNERFATAIKNYVN